MICVNLLIQYTQISVFMIIANPIYDAVFKYLLEDLEIARELLSTILGEEIIDISIKPQETSSESLAYSLTVFRLDFKAVIKTDTGEEKKILIELQKAKHLFDVMRFRRYLGENYRQDDQTTKTIDGEVEKTALPILTIYFLGFKLANVTAPILKVNRVYQNAVTGEILEVKEAFVEQLTHDSYTIQIPRLKIVMQSKLEKVLQVFSQEFRTEDIHKLNFQGDTSEPLVKKVVDKLLRAVSSNEIRKQMEIEDEIDHVFERELKKKDKIIEEERRQKEEERRQKEALLKELEELKKKLRGE